MADINDELAEIFQRLSALETSLQINQTSARDGFFEFLARVGNAKIRMGSTSEDEHVAFTIVDTDGDTALTIGTDSSGAAFIRVMNPDGTAPSFEVAQGVAVFPRSTASWAPNGALPIRSIAQPRPFVIANTFQLMWSAALSLSTDEIDMQSWARDVDAGLTADFELRVDALNGRTGHSSSQVVAASVTGVSGTGITFPSTVTIPPSLWSPTADPVGTVVLLRVYGRVASGADGVKGLTIYTNRPTYCV
mgnify:CR=1 FL=1